MINMNDENTCLTLEELQKSYDWVKVDAKLAMIWMINNLGLEQFIYTVSYAPEFRHHPVKTRMILAKALYAPGNSFQLEEYSYRGWVRKQFDFLESDLYYVPSGNFGEHEV